MDEHGVGPDGTGRASDAGLVLPDTAGRHLAYHVRMAASLAASGDISQCASEALLAWTLLAQHGGGDAADSVADDLPDTRLAGAARDADAVVGRAHALALEIQSHLASEGQVDAAALYESLAAALDGR